MTNIKYGPAVDPLNEDEKELLQQAFQAHDEIILRWEYRSGYSGAKVLLVSLGANLAPQIAKLGPLYDLQREYNAYKGLIEEVLPQICARIQEELLSINGQLAILRYVFVGGRETPDKSGFEAFFHSKGGDAAADVISRVSQLLHEHDQKKEYFLGQEYDRLLPVHLIVEIQQSSSLPDSSVPLQAGQATIRQINKLNPGELTQLLGFRIRQVKEELGVVTLYADPPVDRVEPEIRIQLKVENAPLSFKQGKVIDSLECRVIATRQSYLEETIQTFLPSFSSQDQTLFVERGQQDSAPYSNPLYNLSEWLEQVVTTWISTIHGDLNLQNIIVDNDTGFAWLIDFAETRKGPTFLDFQRLETQAITKLLASKLEQENVRRSVLPQLFSWLHANQLENKSRAITELPVEVQEIALLLQAIRKLAPRYLLNDESWSDYYRGLVVVSLSASRFDDNDAAAKESALLWSSCAKALVENPSFFQIGEEEKRGEKGEKGMPISRSAWASRWVLGTLLLAALIYIVWSLPHDTLPPLPATDTPPATNMPLATDTPSATDTPPATDTSAALQNPKAVFIVSDADAPLEGDKTIQERLESVHNFDVQFVMHLEVTGNEAENADLLLISASIDSPDIDPFPTPGTQFKDVPIPVIIWSAWLLDEMGMAGMGPAEQGATEKISTVSVVAPEHPLAAGFSGTVQITPGTFWVPWGNSSADADVIAMVEDKAVLFAYEAGAKLVDGTPAAGCRISFPAGKISPGRYTDEAWQLFDSAIDWIRDC